RKPGKGRGGAKRGSAGNIEREAAERRFQLRLAQAFAERFARFIDEQNQAKPDRRERERRRGGEPKCNYAEQIVARPPAGEDLTAHSVDQFLVDEILHRASSRFIFANITRRL